MYNIIEKSDDIYREHIIDPDGQGVTVCGLPDVVPASTTASKIMPCFACGMSAPPNEKHKWLREGGRYKPFMLNDLRWHLVTWGLTPLDEEWLKMTPRIYTEIKERVERGESILSKAQCLRCGAKSLYYAPYDNTVVCKTCLCACRVDDLVRYSSEWNDEQKAQYRARWGESVGTSTRVRDMWMIDYATLSPLTRR